MRENKVALVKAIASGDSDLGELVSLGHHHLCGRSYAEACAVYHVLLHLRSTLSPGDFFHILDDSTSPDLTPAVKLLQVYAREGDRQLLRDFYYQDDRRTEQACLEMEEAGTSASPEERLEHLSAAAQAFGQHKDRAFEAKVGNSPAVISTSPPIYPNRAQQSHFVKTHSLLLSCADITRWPKTTTGS